MSVQYVVLALTVAALWKVCSCGAVAFVGPRLLPRYLAQSDAAEPTETPIGESSVDVLRAVKRRRIALTVLLFAALMAWMAHYLHFNRYPSWQETVRLPDGRTITVTQKREYHPGYGTHQSWLTFELQETGGKVTWNQHLFPTMVGVDAGRVYVIGRPHGGRQYSGYFAPKYMYVAFVLEQGRFERIPFLSVPEHLRQIENVRWCFPGGRDERVFEKRQKTAWCDDLDPAWPTPQRVDLNLRMAESKSWTRTTVGEGAPLSE
jgi:hypothetical protein